MFSLCGMCILLPKITHLECVFGLLNTAAHLNSAMHDQSNVTTFIHIAVTHSGRTPEHC